MKYAGMACASLALALSPLIFVHPVRVEGRSMEPTLGSGNLVWALRDWVAGSPRRGEIWLVEGPNGRSIKRVLALPGESLELKTGQLWLNETPLNENWETLDEGGNSGPWQAQDGYLVIGDNRPQSQDSRSWGAIQRKAFKGRILGK